MASSIAYRVKRNPRMITLRNPKDFEKYLRNLNNVKVWRLTYSRFLCDWQKLAADAEFVRRQFEYAAANPTSSIEFWWFK